MTRGSHHDIVSLHLSLFTGQLLTLQLETEKHNKSQFIFTETSQIEQTSAHVCQCQPPPQFPTDSDFIYTLLL